MLTYIENIERNRAAYRATLERRATRSTFSPMKSYLFNELDERGKQAALLRYWYEAPADQKVEIFFTIAKWRFNEHGERIA